MNANRRITVRARRGPPYQLVGINRLDRGVRSSSLVVMGADVRRHGTRVFQGFRFAVFQFVLAQIRSLLRIGSGLDLGFLQKVPPTGPSIFRSLPFLEALDRRLSALFASDYSNHTIRYVGADVVADDCVGSPGFVACQKDSVRKSNPAGLRSL